MSTLTCHLLFDHFQFALIHGPDISGSYATLLFRALKLASITSHIHKWVLFLLWLHPFILSGVTSTLISSSILGTYQLGEFICPGPIFLPFHTVHGFSRQEYWTGLPFPSPMDHVLSELSTMIHLSCVALHSMAHSFFELDKAVVLMMRLVSFLWLWFSVCLLSNGKGKEAYASLLMGETDEGETGSCSDGWSRAQ